jgi:hypothetical protein
MPHRLKALGFTGTESEEGIREALTQLAAASRREGASLHYSGLEGVRIRMNVGTDGQPRNFDAMLDAPLQKVARTDNGAVFPVLDGKPLFRIPVANMPASGTQVGSAEVTVYLSGFGSGVRPVDGMRFGAETRGNLTTLTALLLGQRRVENPMTRAEVSIFRLWLPGLYLPVAVPTRAELATGQPYAFEAVVFAST